METFVAWCGAVGAWLLVAGPLYQGALDLREVAPRIGLDPGDAPDSAVSSWWWLIPPVAVVLLWAEDRRLRRLWETEWDEEQRRDVQRFADRMSGWLIVSAGAFLIALEVTWLLTEALGWPTGAYWGIVLAASAISVGYTAVRLNARDRGYPG